MIIYGWKQYIKVLAVLQLVCVQCGNRAEHVLRKFTTKVTLFWIPLFPINKKHTLFCTACECEQKLPKDQALALAAGQGGPQPFPPQPGQMPGPQPAFGPPSGPNPAFGPPSGPQHAFAPPSGPNPGFGPPPGPQPAPVPPPGYGPPPGPPPGFQGPPPGYPPPGQPHPPQPYPPQGYPPPGYPQR